MPENEFLCTFGKRCILRYRVNDGFSDCPFNTDERQPNFSCSSLEFSCTGEFNRCIPRLWVRNGIRNCEDGSDEVAILAVCLDTEFKCKDHKRCLPKEYLCDGIANCEDGSDEVELCRYPTMFRDFKNNIALIPWSVLLFNDIDDIMLSLLRAFFLL